MQADSHPEYHAHKIRSAGMKNQAGVIDREPQSLVMHMTAIPKPQYFQMFLFVAFRLSLFALAALRST